MSTLHGLSLSGTSLGIFDWDFIDITGSGSPLSTPSVTVTQGQADFGNCKQSEEAIWEETGPYTPSKLVGCKDIVSGQSRYFDPSYAGSSPCPSGQWLNPSGKCEGPGATKPATKPAATGGGGYVAPKPADAPPAPVEDGMSTTSKVAAALVVCAVGLVGYKVAKKRGYLRNEGY